MNWLDNLEVSSQLHLQNRNMSITTKVYLLKSPRENTSLIRRCKIEPNDTYQHVFETALEVFALQTYEHTLQYQDDEGDWICVNSEGEWREAILNHCQSKEQIFRLRLIQLNNVLNTPTQTHNTVESSAFGKNEQHEQINQSDREDQQIKPLRVEDALNYLDMVKQEFNDNPQAYSTFLDIMKDFKAQTYATHYLFTNDLEPIPLES
jgi:hypothetical protein